MTLLVHSPETVFHLLRPLHQPSAVKDVAAAVALAPERADVHEAPDVLRAV